MTKIEFILSLHEKLSALPHNDVEERLNFYSEMIEDRMEEGLSEEDAVLAVGSVDEIAAQILADTPHSKVAEKKQKKKRGAKVWEIILLILGSPIWVSLLLGAFAVALSLYVSLWAVIISLWAVFGSFIGCSIGGILAGVGIILCGSSLTGLATIGAGLVCAGFSIIFFIGSKWATKGTLRLTKKIGLGIKNLFVRKEDNNE